MKKTILYERKEHCCGCGACMAICTQSAIRMIEDCEGFEYPSIDFNLCLNCGMCLTVCPIRDKKN